jgi:hypothetical protein
LQKKQRKSSHEKNRTLYNQKGGEGLEAQACPNQLQHIPLKDKCIFNYQESQRGKQSGDFPQACKAEIQIWGSAFGGKKYYVDTAGQNKKRIEKETDKPESRLPESRTPGHKIVYIIPFKVRLPRFQARPGNIHTAFPSLPAPEETGPPARRFSDPFRKAPPGFSPDCCPPYFPN